MQHGIDWQALKERFTLWWEHKPMDRPLIRLMVPPLDPPPLPEDLEERWLDPDGVLRRNRESNQKTIFLAESYPDYWANLGPGSFGTFLGAEPQLLPETIWYRPCLSALEETAPKLDKESRWWKWSLSMTRRAREEADGEYLVSIPDLVENLDTLAAIVGTEQVLYGLMDKPGEITRIQEALLPLWEEAFQAHYDIVKDQEGWNSFAAFGIFGPGRTAKLQCDLSAMISQAMFDQFVVPYLEQQCRWLDCSIYHLDGPGAVHHLSSLLAIEALHCIQWTPGAGNAEGGDPAWDDIYRRSLDAGKNIEAMMPIEQVRDFVKRFGSRGVFINTTATTQEEGEALLLDLERL